MGLGVILSAALANAACPSVDDELERATAALVDGADPSAALAASEAGLACASTTDAQLARLWLVSGAARQLAGDPEAAMPFYAAARALAPDGFDDRLGDAVRTSWSGATASGAGKLVADRPVKVDGRRVARFPAELASGPHALQAPEVSWARVVMVQSGEDFRVEVPSAPVDGAPKRKSALFAVLGGVALAGAVGAGAGAIAQTDMMASAADVESLDAAWGAQQGLGYAAIGLATLGTTGVVLQFALP
jgi:hypothetical protein